MHMAIDIQGFRDVFDKFILKEVAVVAINTPFVGHWIMRSPYPFAELSEKTRRENNWLSRNYHGLEWFDGEADPEYFTRKLLEIIRTARCIYVRGKDVKRLITCVIYSPETYIIWKKFRRHLKKLSDASESGHRCTYHGFRTDMKFVCALQNAYKLKRWLVARNSSETNSDTSYSAIVSLSGDSWTASDNESEKSDDNFMKNIEAWRRSSAIGEEEKNLRPRKDEAKPYHVNDPVFRLTKEVKEQYLSSIR